MIFLNVDLGELAGEPEALYQAAHAANVACGGHAGDDASMARAAALCARHGTRLGAHPSYPDREGFGRKAVALPAPELIETVREQCASLVQKASAAGLAVTHLKPHGALYHAADADVGVADALLAGAVQSLGQAIAVIGPSGGALEAAARRIGLGYAREGFADRGRRRAPDGRWQLIPRGEPGAIVAGPAEAVVVARRLVDEGEVDTVCVHGDHPRALEIARAVREVLG